jgi:hypothetical protein
MRLTDVASFALLAVVVAAAGFALVSSAADGQRLEAVTDPQGNLHVPSRYRSDYEFLGAWAIAADKVAGSSQIHTVYATPGTIAAYHKTRHFPDGTVLVKEVYETSTAPMTTGTVSHAQTLKGWFVMVKDSNNSHPENLLWGDGWGWSWFDAGDPMKTTSNNYKTNCLYCHVPAKSTDWIYTGGYPTLK